MFIFLSGVSCAEQQGRPISDPAGLDRADAADDNGSDAEIGGQESAQGFTFEQWRANRLSGDNDTQDVDGTKQSTTKSGAGSSDAFAE